MASDPDYSLNNRVKPKEEVDIYNGQRYILRFDPNAPPEHRWHWKVDFTVVYPYTGAAPTINQARNAARRKIRNLLGEHERWAE